MSLKTIFCVGLDGKRDNADNQYRDEQVRMFDTLEEAETYARASLAGDIRIYECTWDSAKKMLILGKRVR